LVSDPTVVYTTDESGTVLEPWEIFNIEVPVEASPSVIEKMAGRQAEMVDMKNMKDTCRMQFHCSSKNFIGMRPFLRDVSKNTAIVTSDFLEHRKKSPPIKLDRNGVIISATTGVTTAYDLVHIQTKGTMFVGEGATVYTGMIIGEHNSQNDIDVNVTRGKALSNVRVKTKEDGPHLMAPRTMHIETALSYIQGDEQLEITPKRVVIRKKILSADERKSEARKASQGK